MGKAEAECVKKYEKLKADCIKPGFKFSIDYPRALLELQAEIDNFLQFSLLYGLFYFTLFLLQLQIILNIS